MAVRGGELAVLLVTTSISPACRYGVCHSSLNLVVYIGILIDDYSLIIKLNKVRNRLPSISCSFQMRSGYCSACLCCRLCIFSSLGSWWSCCTSSVALTCWILLLPFWGQPRKTFLVSLHVLSRFPSIKSWRLIGWKIISCFMLCIDLVTIYCRPFDSTQFSWDFEMQILLTRGGRNFQVFTWRSEVVDNRFFPGFHFLNWKPVFSF